MVTRRYRIEHRTDYVYSDPVSVSFGRGYLRPRDSESQRCVEHRLAVDPEPSDTSVSVDVYGNSSSYFHVTTSHTRLVVRGVSEVEVSAPEWSAEVAGRRWEAAIPAPQLYPADFEFTGPSPLVAIPARAVEYAAQSFTPQRPLIDAIHDLYHRIYIDFRYDSATTTVSTTVSDIFDERSGVCQDFAHLAVACLRSTGLAARYVSGYLSTSPPPGRERMVGVDASHAWAAVRMADGSWLDFDPTNDQLANERYTTVAWGRDYGDVPPLRGVIFTDAKTSTMKVAVDVAPL